jgi:hypothetical protein
LNIPAHSQWKSFPALLMVCFGLTLTAFNRSDAQSLLGTTPSINITTAVPGSEPTPVVSTSSQIRYRGTTFIRKITVRTVCANQKFDLSVVAAGIPVGSGTAASAVTLVNGMLATDFIRDIPLGLAQTTVTLQYTSAPHFSDGTGTDTHTVTYTQAAQ